MTNTVFMMTCFRKCIATHCIANPYYVILRLVCCQKRGGKSMTYVRHLGVSVSVTCLDIKCHFLLQASVKMYLYDAA